MLEEEEEVEVEDEFSVVKQHQLSHSKIISNEPNEHQKHQINYRIERFNLLSEISLFRQHEKNIFCRCLNLYNLAKIKNLINEF